MVVAQVCGLVLLILLLLFTLKSRLVGLFSEKAYIACLMVTIVCVGLDILSVYAIRSDWGTKEVIAKGYLCSLVVVSFFTWIYTIACTENYREMLRKRWVFVAVPVIMIPLICVSEIGYYYDGASLYTYGKACEFTYMAAFTMIFGVFLHARHMRRNRRDVLLVCLILWCGAAIIQYLLPKLLLVGFVAAVVAWVVFTEIENPKSRVDKETGLLLLNVLPGYLREKVDMDYAILVVSIGDREDEYTDEEVSLLRDVVLRYFDEGCRGERIFRNIGSEYLFVLEDMDDYGRIVEGIDKACINAGVRDGLRPTYLVARRSSYFKDVSTFIEAVLSKAYDGAKFDDRGNVAFMDESVYAALAELGETREMVINALEEDRVEIFLQPIYNVKEGKFTCAEVLARIRGKDGGIIPPSVFIEVAERTGLISMIEDMVFEKACKFLRDAELRRLGIEYLEVNLSVKKGESDNVVSDYRGVLNRYGIDGRQINLEITETATLKSRNNLIKNMHGLLQDGLNFSLDDFGSGESNLNYIIEMPVAIVKFDKDMTQGYFENERARIVMGTAIKMIHELGLKVVAEGVETKEQLDELVRINVDYIQGYYFSKPLAREEFVRFIESGVNV